MRVGGAKNGGTSAAFLPDGELPVAALSLEWLDNLECIRQAANDGSHMARRRRSTMQHNEHAAQ
jgi:hypothetical protein